MLLKNKTFSFLVTLSILVFYLVSSHAYFVPRELATGSNAVAVLSNLGGQITFTKLDSGGTGLNGQFTKGITDSNSDNYSLEIGDGISDTFTNFNIQIKTPGTLLFTPAFPVLFDNFIGLQVIIKHNGQTIDQATINLQK
uniref:Adhesin P1 n=1 Tax=Anthurium amnicola TaxID=1678845 RepID=A0A1D1XJ05_9ARAE